LAGLEQLQKNLEALQGQDYYIYPPEGAAAPDARPNSHDQVLQQWQRSKEASGHDFGFPLLLRDPDPDVIVQGALPDVEFNVGEYFSKLDDIGEQRFFQIQKDADGGFYVAEINDLEDDTPYIDLDRGGTDFVVSYSDTVTNAPSDLAVGDYVVGHFESGESPRAFQIIGGSDGTYDIHRVDIDNAIDAHNRGDTVTNLQNFSEENFTFYDDNAFEQFRFEYDDSGEPQLTPAREIPEFTSFDDEVYVASFMVQLEGGQREQYVLVHGGDAGSFQALPIAEFSELSKQTGVGGAAVPLTHSGLEGLTDLGGLRDLPAHSDLLSFEELQQLPDIGIEVVGLGGDGNFDAAPVVQGIMADVPVAPSAVQDVAPVAPQAFVDPVIGGGNPVGTSLPNGDFIGTTAGRLPPELSMPDNASVQEVQEQQAAPKDVEAPADAGAASPQEEAVVGPEAADDNAFEGVQYDGGDIREWLKVNHSIMLPELPNESDKVMTNAFQAQVSRAAQGISFRAEAGEIDPAAQYEIVAAFGVLDAGFGEYSYGEHINTAFEGGFSDDQNLNGVMAIEADRLNDFVIPAEAASRAAESNAAPPVEYNR